MPTAPYDFLETVANMARVRLNDAIVAIGGDIFTDTAAFSLTAVNNGWRRLQEYLTNQGHEALNREVIFTAVPLCTAADQGIRVWFDWTEYFDGTNPQTAPVYPQDMIAPLILQERVSGGTGNFTPMDRVMQGLPTAPRSTLNRLWEYRQERVYMPGATGLTDILMRYGAYLADFVAPGTTAWNLQPVPIMRSADSFAWFIASEIARARGDLDAGWFDQQALQAAEWIWNRDYRPGRALYKQSELGKMTEQDTPTAGPAAPRGPNRIGGNA